MSHARYLGDGVYASFDGYSIVLTTGNHQATKADNVIVMEFQVVESFEEYIKDLKQILEAGIMREQI
jgi:hypothetical protein